MEKLRCKTLTDEIEIEPSMLEGNCFLTFKVNGIFFAKMEISYVWDFLKDTLSQIGETDSPGLKRRIYEARNIFKLTNEYLKKARTEIGPTSGELVKAP